jgi:peptidyl-prolyl cis-trans isomerase C
MMRSFTKARLAGASALAGVLVLGWAVAAQDAAPVEEGEAEAEAAAGGDFDASTVLARVNGTEITLGHVVVLRERLPEQFQALPDETLLQGLIDQLVDQELLARSVSEAPEDDPLAVRLHLENERRGTLAQQAVRARIAEEIDEAAIAAAYEEATGDFEAATEWRASHIIVPTEEQAQELREEVDGGADFAELAREHSQDGAAERGGDLGWFGTGQMVPEFEEAVADMEAGEVRGPIQTQFGWHLVRLEETRETEPPALEEVRQQIVEQVRQQRLGEEIEAMRAEAEIERPETGVPPAAIRDATIIED